MGGLEQLRHLISEQDLSSEEAEILLHVAKDGNGWTLRETPGILAECTGHSRDNCSTAMSNLLADGWLTRDGGSRDRIQVNWDKLNVSEEMREEVRARPSALANLGNPRSTPAREELLRLYEENPRLYLCLGVTPPERFVGLEDRVRHGRPTTLLMPGRRYAGSLEHRELYNHTLDSWRKWLQEGNRAEHVEFRITHRPFWFLHTSALSRGQVRFTVYMESQTTSSGELVSADRDSSLYRAIATHYRDALLFSAPWWRFHKKRLAGEIVKRSWPLALFAAAVAVAVIFNSAAMAVVSAAFAGVAGNSAARQWTRRPRLFES